MTTRTRIASLAAVALVAALGAPGVGAAETLRADVPFDFVVAGRTMPAGTYDVMITDAGLIRLDGASGGRNAAVLTFAIDDDRAPGDPALVFVAANDTHALAEVRRAGGSGRALPPSFTVRARESYERIAIALRPRPASA